jgi:prepilin-type N-terminal cleavage/methylation domain-containing protein
VIEAIQRRMAARSDEDRQGGFTLIELMVVVMIIAILVGIAIPAFLGARKRAQDTAAKSNVRNALSTAQTVFTDNQAYGNSAALLDDLVDEEPSLTFVGNAADSDDPKEISVKTATSAGASAEDIVTFAAASKSGKCYFLRHVATAGLVDPLGPLSGSWIAETDTNTACSADDGVVGLTWKAL